MKWEVPRAAVVAKHHVLLHGYSSLPPRQLAGFRLFYRIDPKAYALGYGKWRPAGSIY